MISNISGMNRKKNAMIRTSKQIRNLSEIRWLMRTGDVYLLNGPWSALQNRSKVLVSYYAGRLFHVTGYKVKIGAMYANNLMNKGGTTVSRPLRMRGFFCFSLKNNKPEWRDM